MCRCGAESGSSEFGVVLQHRLQLLAQHDVPFDSQLASEDRLREKQSVNIRRSAAAAGGRRGRERRGTFWGLSLPRNTSMKSSSETEKVTSALEAPLSRDPRPVFRSTAARAGAQHHQQSLSYSRINMQWACDTKPETITPRAERRVCEGGWGCSMNRAILKSCVL